MSDGLRLGLIVDIHAFLGWFDIAFSCCHKPIQFSTGPHAKVSRDELSSADLSVYALEADRILHS